MGGTSSKIMFFAMWCETRDGRTCKTNVRICSVERVQGCNGIRQDKPYNRKILVG